MQRAAHARICASAALGLLLVAPRASLALDPRRPLDRMAFDTWQVQDGLPQGSVSDIVQTRDGYIWVSTLAGIARFNGASFTRFDERSASALGDARFAVLLAARNGDLWVGSEGGLAFYRDGAFAPVKLPPKVGRIYALLEDADGTIWIGAEQGLFRHRTGEVSRYGSPAGWRGLRVNTILRDRKGRLVLGTQSGVMVAEDERPVVYPAAAPLPEVHSLLEDRRGRLWVGASNGPVLIGDGQITRLGSRDPVLARRTNGMVSDRDGSIWIATYGGVARFHDDELDTLAAGEALPGAEVQAIYVDGEGSVWVGTSGGGLVRLTDRALPVLEVAHGNVNSVCEDETGALWIGGHGGLFRSQNDVVTRVAPWGNPLALAPGAPGELFVASPQGLQRWVGGRAIAVDIPGWPADFRVRALHRGARGGVWVGGTSGLARIEGDRIDVYGRRDGLPSSSVMAIREDARGAIWVGMFAGLYRRDGSRFVAVSEGDELKNRIHDLYVDAEGTAWLGTRGAGLARLKAGRLTSFGRREGLDDDVYQILEDDVGRLWLGSYGGIRGVSKQALDDVAAGRRTSVPAISFEITDRRRALPANRGSQPGAWKGRGGRLWFSTREGVAFLDPARVAPNPTKPPIAIERLVVDGRDRPLGGEPRLQAGTLSVELHYAALSFLQPHRIRYRYRLEGLPGLGDRWQDAEDRRVATFVGLPPGRYTFRVAAANSDGVWNEAGAALSFRLEPRFTQTGWFYALCLTLAIAAVASLHRLRLSRLRAVYGAVLGERTRMARELHDKLLQGITAVTWQIDGASAQLPQAPSNAKAKLEVAQTMLSKSAQEARRLVWDLRTERPGRGDLAEAIGSALDRLGTGQPARVAFQVRGAATALSHAAQEHLFEIAKEAVTNALKHAQASRIDVLLEYSPDAVRMMITDDGRGLATAPDAPPGHFGLAGLRERAAELGAALAIDSPPGGGTSVAITMPLKGRTDV